MVVSMTIEIKKGSQLNAAQKKLAKAALTDNAAKRAGGFRPSRARGHSSGTRPRRRSFDGSGVCGAGPSTCSAPAPTPARARSCGSSANQPTTLSAALRYVDRALSMKVGR